MESRTNKKTFKVCVYRISVDKAMRLLTVWRTGAFASKALAHFEVPRLLPKEARGALRLNKFCLPGLRKKRNVIFFEFCS